MRRWNTALSDIVPALCLAALPALAAAVVVSAAGATSLQSAASATSLPSEVVSALSSGSVLPSGFVQPGGPLQPGGSLRPGGPPQPLGRSLSALGTRSRSANWSGYDVTGGPFTSVTATWTQPRARPSADFTDAAFWVGLDGDTADSSSSPTVEQIGTESFTLQGAHYDAWYEMYPDYAHYIYLGHGHNRHLMAIRPGDVTTASVTWNGTTSFTLSLVNETTGRSFSTTKTIAKDAVQPERSSAEVVVEAPRLGDGTLLPVANFGLVRFRGCAFDDQPIAAFDWSRIDMVSPDTHATEVATSALSPDGTAFNDTTDFRRPTTTVTGTGKRWFSKPVTLHLKASDNLGGTGVAYTQFSLDGGATWTKGRTVRLEAPSDHSGDGAAAVWYRSADKAGNLEKTRVRTVHIDTRKPTPLAKWPAVATRGGQAVLRYYVGDPRPGSPTATVTIRIRDERGALVKKIVLPDRKVDISRTCSFGCPFAKGAYRVFVSATDLAGNPSTAAAATSLVVH